MLSRSTLLSTAFLLTLSSLQWSCKESVLVPMPQTIEELEQEAREMPSATPPVETDIPYHSDLFDTYALDLYYPLNGEQSESHPLILFFHGGSWIAGDKVTIRIIDRFLDRMRKAGYYVASVGYTTAPIRGIPASVKIASHAYDWALTEGDLYGFDRDRIGFYGVSAGGHIALMIATHLEESMKKPAFVFAECAPTDLLGMRSGEAFDKSWVFRMMPKRFLRKWSPIEKIPHDLPPILLFHGEVDETVHVNQSKRYAEAVRGSGNTADLFLYPEGGHAFLNLPDQIWYEQETVALGWIAEKLR